jgi:ribosomal protein S18 acetylase RimI-like enzyme
MSISVDKALSTSTELLTGLNSLLPQLSANARALTMSDVEAVIDADAATLFVASNNDVIVGTLTLVIFPIPSGLRGWIEDVVVDEGARGLGVGEALTKAALEEARRRGVRSLDLTSRSSREAANALYQKLGFERRDTNVYRFFVDDAHTSE